MTQHKITTYLNQGNKPLGRLLTRVQQLNQWNQWLFESLSDDYPLSNHCQIVNFDRNSLIVIVDSANWLVRLRFLIPGLIQKLKKYPGLEATQAICCKVKPPHQAKFSTPGKRRRMTLSVGSASAIREIAQEIKDDTLRKILEKMAEH